MMHSTRSERREARTLGASVPLYRRARRAGATHDEVLSVLREGMSFWRYELFRTGGASHSEALELDSEGVDAISYRDLRRIGVGDDEVLDAKRRGLPLDVYCSARNAGLAPDDAAALLDAGFLHAANRRAWKKAARARQLLAGKEQASREKLALVVRWAPAYKGDADALVEEIIAGEPAARERAA